MSVLPFVSKSGFSLQKDPVKFYVVTLSVRRALRTSRFKTDKNIRKFNFSYRCQIPSNLLLAGRKAQDNATKTRAIKGKIA